MNPRRPQPVRFSTRSTHRTQPRNVSGNANGQQDLSIERRKMTPNLPAPDALTRQAKALSADLSVQETALTQAEPGNNRA